MTQATYALIENIGLWHVTRDGSLLAGFAEREIAESFLLQQVNARRADGRSCRVLIKPESGAQYEWSYAGIGDVGVARQLH